MKISRKVIESAAVIVFALALVVTAITAEGINTEGDQYTKEADTEQMQEEVATKEKINVTVVAQADKAESAERAETSSEEFIGSAEDTAVLAGTSTEEETAEVVEETPVAETVSEWDNKLMPDVKKYLNIRAEANEEAKLVGKLYKGAAADILERGEEWTKISSGKVEGYVKNEYCVFGAEAEAMAKELGTVYATASVGGLRVRAEASATEETDIVDVLEKGEKIKADTKTEAPEGWVAVICSKKTAYVSAEYVTVKLEVGKAISIEEEREALRKAEQEKAAKKAASAKKQQAAAQAKYDEVTLLAALIQCEAGGEPYEGKVAVGAVVMNRLESGYASSIYGVIYQKGQFTPVASGSLAKRLSRGVSSSCIQAAKEALSGVDNVNGAKNFRRVSSGRQGLVIGNHVFF